MSREERAGRNESFFRELNDELVEQDDSNGAVIEIVCECVRLGCMEPVTLRSSEYERVRADPRQFVLKPGHEEPDLETSLERLDNAVVVRKHGEAGEVAVEEDAT